MICDPEVFSHVAIHLSQCSISYLSVIQNEVELRSLVLQLVRMPKEIGSL